MTRGLVSELGSLSTPFLVISEGNSSKRNRHFHRSFQSGNAKANERLESVLVYRREVWKNQIVPLFRF
ncbi:MAG: hypothetical protein R3C49_11535 [Planctomycetaceae bacterium]